MSYNPCKAAQTIAFFAMKNGGRPLNTVKAVKLVYLADRESIATFGALQIQDERRVSMRLGPVNSRTYDYIKGEVPPEENGGWSRYLTDREQHKIGLADPDLTLSDLDELSEADVSVLEVVWSRFGSLDQWQLVEWTHDPQNLPEWTDPNGGSTPITLEAIMEAVGCRNAAQMSDDYRGMSAASDLLRAL